jgi:integrase
VTAQVLGNQPYLHVLTTRKRLDPEEAKKRVLALVNAGITSPTDIAKSIGWTGKNARINAHRYLNMLAEEGKLKKDSSTGRIIRSAEMVSKQQYVDLQRDAFAQIPSVAAWIRDMLTRVEGKPKKSWKASLSFLYGLCEKLKVRPEQLYTPVHNPDTGVLMSKRQTAEYFLQEFAIKYPTNHNSYVLAVRDFTSTIGEVAWPRGRGGVASGKKRSYGKFAHVKLGPGQFERGIEICEAKGDLLLRDIFEFGVEQGNRRQTLLLTRVNDFDIFPDHLINRVHESKTEGHGIADWDKGVYTPKTVGDLKYRIESARAEGQEFVFCERGKDGEWKSRYTLGEELNSKLKLLYREIGLTDPYVYAHPFHAMRHFCAHYWLEKTNYDYTVVKGQTGHKTTEVLEDCYGKMPPDIRDRKLRAAVQTMGVNA